MRALIVGGGIGIGGSGSRGLELTRALIADGHAVRAAADEAHRAEVEAAGAECWVGDPDRIGTLRYALENVTVLLWLLADSEAPELHGPRLEMMLERTIDTTVRGVIYESSGPFGAQGAEIVERMAGRNEIPFALIEADPGDQGRWLEAVLEAVATIVEIDRSALPAAWDRP